MADVFISHVDADKSLAEAVERLLRDAFEPQPGPTTFLSSNMFTLVGGEQFEERIRKELRDCSALVAMCSRRSFERHWLHVESGAVWASGKPVIPACYGGMTRGSLPRPYSSFQAVDLSDPYTLIIAVARVIKTLTPPPPPIHLIDEEKFEGRLANAMRPYQGVLEELRQLYPS